MARYLVGQSWGLTQEQVAGLPLSEFYTCTALLQIQHQARNGKG